MGSTSSQRAVLRLCASLLALAISSTGALATTARTTASTQPYPIYSFGGFTELFYGLCGTGFNGTCGNLLTNGFDTFGYIGAVMEGTPTVNTTAGTMTRKIFVVDQAAGTTKKEVALDIYQLVTPLAGSTHAPATSKVASIALPLTGGMGVKTLMAGNGNYLFISTNKSPVAVKFDKTRSTVTQVGGFTPAINVSSITSNKYGYVTVAFGGLNATSGNYQFAPDGSSLGDGGSALFMLGTTLGISNFDIPLNSTTPTAMLTTHRSKGGESAQANGNPDAGLYISYGIDAKYRNISASVCGSLSGTTGCFGSGTLGTFGRVGAMVEGSPVVDKTTHTVTRDVYVFDQQAPASAGGPAVLYDYQIAEAIAGSNATVTVTRKNSVKLALAGGFSAKAFMAANDTDIFVGDNLSYSMFEVNKATLATTIDTEGTSPPSKGTSITTNADGYVMTGFGFTGFFNFSPTGAVESGFGECWMAGSTQALTTSDVQTE